MPHVAEFGLLAGTLAEQGGGGVGGREMGVGPALLGVEVALGVAPTATMTFSRWRIAAVLRRKALHAGPSLDQGAIDREVLAGEQLADLRQVQHADKELGRDIAVEQPSPGLAEDRRSPQLIIRREPDEPPEQQIVV